ncbi:universal stress protein [Patulibacter sp. SYSU D01012]|uniref:universal stress protein n=1 Tax=Patulibacter sp. SYSU D01012 TaxID=2817381 RepID=UPI001B313DCD|nr:universal stress protein [Patulibacter sp. SYSU D01012]
MLERIVTGFVDTPGGHDALALAAGLADLARGSELTVARVCGYEPAPDGLPPGAAHRELLAAAELELAAARVRWGARPGTSFTACLGVSPAEGLHRLAEELDASALVVGVSARAARVRVGSATEQTLHGSPCAVGVAPPGLATAGWRPRTVAVACHGSDDAVRAVGLGAELAQAAGARLVLAGVAEQPVWWGGYPDLAEVRDVRELTARGLRAVRDRVPGAEAAELRVLDGDPASALTVLGDEVELLVLGSRGHGPVRRVLLGSVSSRLVRRPRCPLLVVPRGARTGAHPARADG